MGLIPCPDCGKQVSERAVACPECGRPFPAAESVTASVTTGPTCRHCRQTGVARVRGLHGGAEVVVCLVLCLAGLLPGVVYYVYRESRPYCPHCGRRN
jgi:uncharacterized membrane protein YvbJ